MAERAGNAAGEAGRRPVPRSEIGAPPSAIFVPPDAEPTRIVTHVYDAGGHELREGFAEKVAAGKQRWIDISGLADTEAIAGVAGALGLSDLAIAELFQTDLRPQTEVLGDLVQSFLRHPVSGPPYRAEQVSLVLGPGFVLSIRERAPDCFAQVRRRLEAGSGRIRSAPGYLFYALADALLDTWFPLLEGYGDKMEELEAHILSSAQDGAVMGIHRLRRDLLNIRRAIWPLREAIGALLKDDVPQIEQWMEPYFRDCSDHAFQALDMVEVYREVAQGLIDLHMSALSNRMNEVMKVLTIIATVFIPMTFIAGLYGMNFDRSSPWNMPELGWRFGYVFSLALMLGSAGIMVYLFYRLGWIGRWPRPADLDQGADEP